MTFKYITWLNTVLVLEVQVELMGTANNNNRAEKKTIKI